MYITIKTGYAAIKSKCIPLFHVKHIAVGKDEPMQKIEPRLLLHHKEKSYGEAGTGHLLSADPRGQSAGAQGIAAEM